MIGRDKLAEAVRYNERSKSPPSSRSWTPLG